MTERLKKLDIDQLLLDPQNPRLPQRFHQETKGKSLNNILNEQDDILEYLAKASSIAELISAISENGFFAGEALIVTPLAEKYLVVEGNRRLTALKMLNGKIPENMPARVRKLIDEATHKPREIPVYIYGDRTEVLNYLGNRHIAGVKAWGALAKARYVKQLYKNTNSKLSFEKRCRKVAKVIGSRRDYISKTLRAFEIFELAEKEDFFGLPELDADKLKFSLLSTAIDYSGVAGFLRDTKGGDLHPERVKELLRYMFVPREGKTRPPLGESRKIGELSKVLESDDALAAFRGGASLSMAYLKSAGIEDDFDRNCFETLEKLRFLNSIAAEVDATDERNRIANTIAIQAKRLERQIE